MRVWKLHSKNLNNNQQNNNKYSNRFIEEEKHDEEEEQYLNSDKNEIDSSLEELDTLENDDKESNELNNDSEYDKNNNSDDKDIDDDLEANDEYDDSFDNEYDENNKSDDKNIDDDLEANDEYDDSFDNEYDENNKSDDKDIDDDLLDDFFDHDIDKSPGYNIVKKDIEVNDYIIKNVINKFINMRFYNTDSNLNSVSCSYNKARGFIEWDKKLIVKHLTTKQYNKILDDKYAYDYETLGTKSIPLSFYFDLSGSMASFSHLLTVIAKCLLDNGIKVLVGFNETVKIQVNEISDTVSIDEFQKFIEASAGGNNYTDLDIDYDIVDTNIDEYLISNRAEKCVLFTDYDAINECFNLSNYADTYWLCFRDIIKKSEIEGFNGFIYQVKSKNDIYECFLRMTSYSYEAVKSFGRVLK